MKNDFFEMFLTFWITIVSQLVSHLAGCSLISRRMILSTCGAIYTLLVFIYENKQTNKLNLKCDIYFYLFVSPDIQYQYYTLKVRLGNQHNIHG